MRWEDDGFWATNLDRYERGVEKDRFSSYLFANEFAYNNKLIYWLKEIHNKYRPKYMKTFNYKMEDILKRSVEENYIDKISFTSGRGKERLIVTEKGRKFISHLYLPKLFFGNAYIKAVIISIIGVFTTWYITENIINKISNSIIESKNHSSINLGLKN
jgi:hypothetical protein